MGKKKKKGTPDACNFRSHCKLKISSLMFVFTLKNVTQQLLQCVESTEGIFSLIGLHIE